MLIIMNLFESEPAKVLWGDLDSARAKLTNVDNMPTEPKLYAASAEVEPQATGNCATEPPPSQEESPSKSKDRKTWEQRWRDPGFSPRWWVEGCHELISEAVERELPWGCSILEIGCGAGQGAAWLQRAGFNVTGIDIAPAAIKRAQRDFGTSDGPEFVVADVTGQDPLGRTFDAIIDSGCLHRILPELRPAYVRNVVSWSHAQTTMLLLLACPNRQPLELANRISNLFEADYEMLAHQARTGCLPKNPELMMLVCHMLRREVTSTRRGSSN